MRSGTRRSRAAQLDRDIAQVLSKKPHHATIRGCVKCGPHHATIRECATWDPGAPIEHLTEAKRQSAAEYERCYLVNLMQKAGSVSEAARLAGLDRSNFKKLLQRHGMRAPKE
jgi:transcriptional regulator with GAF, ATPase, and Fis domain